MSPPGGETAHQGSRRVEPPQQRHEVTGTLTYDVIRCGGCKQTWEQLTFPGDHSGEWWVCPNCLHAAPTDRPS